MDTCKNEIMMLVLYSSLACLIWFVSVNIEEKINSWNSLLSLYVYRYCFNIWNVITHWTGDDLFWKYLKVIYKSNKTDAFSFCLWEGCVQRLSLSNEIRHLVWRYFKLLFYRLTFDLSLHFPQFVIFLTYQYFFFRKNNAY